MKAITEHNPDLAEVMPQGYGSLPDKVLRELLRILQPLDISGDAYGAIFEYTMGEFASAYMHKGGEYLNLNRAIAAVRREQSPRLNKDLGDEMSVWRGSSRPPFQLAKVLQWIV